MLTTITITVIIGEGVLVSALNNNTKHVRRTNLYFLTFGSRWKWELSPNFITRKEFLVSNE
jgi:hypothetical protein